MASGLSPSVICVAPASTKIGMEIMNTLSKQNEEMKIYELAGLISEDSIGQERMETLDKLDLSLYKTRFDEPGLLKEKLLKIKPTYLVLVSSSSSPEQDNTHNLTCLIDIAQELKIEGVLLLSTVRADQRNTLWAAEFHPVEEHLKSKSIPWVILRSGFLTENLLYYVDDIRKTSKLHLPTNGYFAPISVKDVAKCVNVICQNFEKFKERTFELTGTKTKHGEGIAKAFEKAFPDVNGIGFETHAPEEHVELLKQCGIKKHKIDTIMSFYRAVENNEMNFASPDFQHITGEMPSEIKEILPFQTSSRELRPAA